LAHLTRHIILHICVLGNYLQEHSIKGNNTLKSEIQRLTTPISFLHSALETTWKQFTITDVELAITGIRTSIREFLLALAPFYAQLKPKLEAAYKSDKENLGIRI